MYESEKISEIHPDTVDAQFKLSYMKLNELIQGSNNNKHIHLSHSKLLFTLWSNRDLIGRFQHKLETIINASTNGIIDIGKVNK